MTTNTSVSEPTASEAASNAANLRARLTTSLMLMPVVLLAVYVGGWLFTIASCGLAVIAVLEFYELARGHTAQGRALIGVPMTIAVMLAFQLQQDGLWVAALVIGAIATFVLQIINHPHDVRRSILQMLTTLLGVAYVAFPFAFMIRLRSLPDGLLWLLVVFALTWGTDTFSYVGGRLWGRNKLAPTLSPKKTVEGAIVGILGGMLPALIILALGSKLSQPALILVALGPFVAIAGDLFESAMKRFFHVKDSGIKGLDIFPGHGGALDRIDALLLVTAYVFAFVTLFKIIP